MENKIESVVFLNDRKVITNKKINKKRLLRWWGLSSLVFLIITFIGLPVRSIVTQFIMAFTFIITGALIKPISSENEIIYDVAVLDETAIDELKEKYEIIKRDGKLYTVKEKITEECEKI